MISPAYHILIEIVFQGLMLFVILMTNPTGYAIALLLIVMALSLAECVFMLINYARVSAALDRINTHIEKLKE